VGRVMLVSSGVIEGPGSTISKTASRAAACCPQEVQRALVAPCLLGSVVPGLECQRQQRGHGDGDDDPDGDRGADGRLHVAGRGELHELVDAHHAAGSQGARARRGQAGRACGARDSRVGSGGAPGPTQVRANRGH
jgi:hypothetical protein